MKQPKEYIISLLEKGKRENRGLLDYREIKCEINTLNQANGSARVKIGDTDVLVGVKFNAGQPFPDTPNEGVLITSGEFPPLASPNFESGPPRQKDIEFARVIDRTIRESGALDFSKLVITPGEKVWMIFIDIYPINDGGNLFDAASIGAILALKNARLPKYDEKEDKILHRELTKNKIDLEKIPILCTFGKIGDNIILDPDLNEESALDARLSIATIENGDICAMQKGGLKGLSEKEIELMIDTAIEKGKTLRKLLKKHL